MEKKISHILRLIAALALLVSGCKTPQLQQTKEISIQNKTPKILFLNGEISYDSLSQEYTIELINKILSYGKIKPNPEHSHIHIENQLNYRLLNKNKQVIDDYAIPNPLLKDIEYIDDNGQMGRKRLQLKQAEFSIRVQLPPTAGFMAFSILDKQLLLIDLKE